MTVKLSEISPSKTNPRKFFDEQFIKELSESIKENGLLQPILIRPSGKGYELVCGEQRYRASKLAGLPDILANIKQMTDEQVLHAQIIENLQRKDISPMEEAAGFKNLIEKNKFDIKEIAKRVGKSDSYVAFRLKLNDLSDNYQKAMHKGSLNIGDALWICRLSKEDQAELYKENNHQHDTHIELSEWDKKPFSNDITKAPFDTKDASLFKEAGACVSCVFNSACNSSLFPELANGKATCQKSVCYKKKCQLAFDKELAIAKEEPGMVFITAQYSFQDDKLKKALEKEGIKVVTNYDYNTSQKNKPKAIKAFCVEGSGKGQYQYIILTKAEKKTSAVTGKGAVEGKASTADIKEEIKRIEDAEVRNKELDEEKISPMILEIMDENKAFISNTKTLSHAEFVAAVITVHDCIGYDMDMEDLLEKQGYKEDGVEPVLFNFLNSNPKKLEAIFNGLLRILILDKVNKGKEANAYKHETVMGLRHIALQYDKTKTQAIIDAQKEITDKRELRVKQRLDELKQSLPAESKKATKK